MQLIDLSEEVQIRTVPSAGTSTDAELITRLDTGNSEDESASSEFEQPVLKHTIDTQTDTKQAQLNAFNEFVQQENSREKRESKAPTSDTTDGNGVKESQKIINRAREYQQELFERAKEENVIAVLDTGSGKTLIACLLIRWTLEQEHTARARGRAPRVVFFLANSVHLVQQQARVLTDNLSDNVISLSGTRIDLSNRGIWTQIFENNEVVVCTPAILEQCLSRAFLDMSQISLLVFDEAHHAKKEHPYSKLIRSYYLKCPKEDRPRIFGMTASPVDSKKDITTTVQDLEDLLHSKIITTEDMTILSFAPKPTDVKWAYPRLRIEFETDLHQKLSSLCRRNEELRKFFEFSRRATSQLGLWCADRVWKLLFDFSTNQSSSVRKNFEQSDAYKKIKTAEERQQVLKDLDEACLIVQQHQYGKPHPDTLYLSPKVLYLYKQLKLIYDTNPSTRAIVFVNERLKAIMLHDLFRQLNIQGMRPGILLGIASGTEGSTLCHQEQMLDDFRRGLVNIVFATSVADEGLDIPQCNLCIRFDLCATTIQYMQSRGRARMAGSIFAHMIQEDDPLEEGEVDFQIEDEQYIKRWCANLPPDRRLGKGTKLAKLIAQDSANRSFKTSGGAMCDFSNSLLVIARFAKSLQHTGATESEIYEEEIDQEKKLFRYIVRLPGNSQSQVKGCRGEWRSNKQLAKRSAAFSTCYRLREVGELDEGLNSIFKKVKPHNLNAHLAVSAKKHSYAVHVKPEFWRKGLNTVPTKLYASSIGFCTEDVLVRSLSEMVILTRQKLPSIPSITVYREGRPIEVSLHFLPTIEISEEELDLLTSFTLQGVFSDVFNKVYANEPEMMSYWLAPKTDMQINDSGTLNSVVDVEALRATCEERIQWTPGMPSDRWIERFLCDPLNGKFHYLSGPVVPNASINDPVPYGVPKLSQKKMGSVIDFSDSTWTASRKKVAQAEKYDPNQPVLKAKLVSARRDFLGPSTEKDFIDCLIAPQTLQIARIVPSVAASCLIWPTILYRIESHMIAIEAFEKLGLSGVSAGLALEAFTKTADSDEEEQQAADEDGKRGIGNNYERLEFIGDSLLKMTTTLTIFNRTKCDEEGMHCRRMEILCNQRLYDVSMELELYKHARTLPFNRNTWYPEHLKLLHGRGAKKVPESVKHPEMTQGLGAKTIADISEAVIGAAVTTSLKTNNNFDLGIQAITKLVNSEDHDVNCWDDIRNMYVAPDWSLLTDDPVANDLAVKITTKTSYSFKRPRLLRSAFTHSSDTNSPVPDLQRLEFLGDAVLDWVCISWLFYSHPNKNPQWLTEHKMAMVSNKFLAALAVVLDFDKFIFTNTAALLFDIQAYARKVRDALANLDCLPNFWTEIEHPPKALSDLVESYLGAVLIDSNFNYVEVESFFEKHVKHFFEDIEAYDTFANRHPTTYLHRRLEDDFQCRNFRVLASEPQEGTYNAEIMAGVVIHQKVAGSSKGTGVKYAKVRASKEVLRKLDGMTPEEFRKEFGCDCKQKIAG